MKRFFLNYLLLLTTPFLSIAQPVYTDPRTKVDTGPGYPAFEGRYDEYDYVLVGDHALAIKLEKNHLTLQLFARNDMKLVSSKVYSDMPDDIILEGSIKLKNKIYCAYSTYPSKTLIPHFFVREIDINTGTFKGPGVELFAADKKVESLNVYFKNQRKFLITLNTDSTSFLVQYSRPSSTGMFSTGPETHGMYIYNLELKKIRGSEILFPYHEKQMRPMDYTFDEVGNIYMTVFHFTKLNNDNLNELSEKDYKGEILRLAKDETVFKKFDLNLGGKVANFIKMVYHPGGYVICAGVYSTVGNLKKTEGIFTCKLNQNGSVSDIKKNDYKPGLIKESKKKSKVGSDEFYKVRDIILQPDNGILVFTEQIFHYSGTGDISRHYDLILTKFDASFNITWMSLLPKKSWVGSTVDAPSYRYLKSGNSIFIVFLDDYDNLGSFNSSKEIIENEDGIHGFINCYKVNATTGDVINFPILNMKNVNGKEYHNYLSRKVINFGTNELWYEVYKKSKESCMIRIVLEE